MADKKLVNCGRYVTPEDSTKPYWVAIEWFPTKPPLVQPLSEGEFFMLLGRIFAKYNVSLDVTFV